MSEKSCGIDNTSLQREMNENLGSRFSKNRNGVLSSQSLLPKIATSPDKLEKKIDFVKNNSKRESLINEFVKKHSQPYKSTTQYDPYAPMSLCQDHGCS
jgi:hypothetical protein